MTSDSRPCKSGDLRSEPWLDRSIALLDQSADALDAATLSRLTQARHAAAAHARVRRSRWWIGAAGAACAAALVLAFGLHPWRDPPAGTPVAAVAVDALATDDDNLDLYQDLDFYAWLDADEQRGGEG